jgi:uncharacterized protein DUF6791/ThiF family protein
MSRSLIARSADLCRLSDEGYEVSVLGGNLVVGNVPYVNSRGEVRHGALVSELTLCGDRTAPPSSHVAYFRGDCPCDRNGMPLVKVVLDGQRPYRVTADLVARYTLSSKPPGAAGYPDYYAKMITYAGILGIHAQSVAPDTSAQAPGSSTPVADADPETPFRYLDTASGRAGIGPISAKLAVPRIAIVGLGGTGSYILDLVAKTPVGEVHLFDGDRFLQHNAFRAPGAPTAEQLGRQPLKVDYLSAVYSPLHRGIVPHPYLVDAGNVADLDDMTFVFLAMDDGAAKQVIIRHLEARQTPFIDVGIGVYEVAGCLAGLIRTTLSTEPAAWRDAARARISLGRPDASPYDRNIQVADLNALAAALAVIAWKKLMGFYNDLAHEYFTAYAIDTSSLINDLPPNP